MNLIPRPPVEAVHVACEASHEADAAPGALTVGSTLRHVLVMTATGAACLVAVVMVALEQPIAVRLLSSDHFSVDGTMIEAWSSMKSVKPIEPGEGPGDEPPPSSGGRNAETDFHGTTRTNATHASTTDPEAKLYRKGCGHGGEARLPRPRPDGEPLRPRRRRLPDAGRWPRRAARRLGDDREASRSPPRHHAGRRQGIRHVRLRERAALDERTPARGAPPGSAIDRRTTRHPGYAASQRIRKRIEEAFGWMKTIGGMRRPMRRGTDRVGWAFTFAAAAYNLVRLPKLLAEPAT